MKVKRMGTTEILRRIWLFSENKIKSCESFSKLPTQLKLNSSLRHIIVTQGLTVLLYILWFEAKDGTILAPSDEAFEKVDKERLDFIIGNDYLRAEMLGLHFVRERITSTDRKIQGSDDMVI